MPLATTLRSLLNLLKNRRGVAGLQFAMVMPLFMLFTGMILENGLLMFNQAMLDNAAAEASRLIRTGQVQLAGGTAAPFSKALCDNLSAIINCANLSYSVTAANSFASLSTAASVGGNGKLVTKFQPGTPGQDVVVQVGYTRTFLMPWVSTAVTATGKALLLSVVVFQNERFQ